MACKEINLLFMDAVQMVSRDREREKERDRKRNHCAYYGHHRSLQRTSIALASNSEKLGWYVIQKCAALKVSLPSNVSCVSVSVSLCVHACICLCVTNFYLS